MPKLQPTSHGCGSSANSAYSIAAATSYCSATPLSKAPPLVPRGLLTPRRLNLQHGQAGQGRQPGRGLAEHVAVHEAAVGRQRVQRDERRHRRPVDRPGQLADQGDPVGGVQLDVLANRRKHGVVADILGAHRSGA